MATGDFILTMPQIREAVKHYQAGYSVRQIAARFGVSDCATRNALTYMGVKFREKHEARRLRWSVAGVPCPARVVEAQPKRET